MIGRGWIAAALGLALLAPATASARTREPKAPDYIQQLEPVAAHVFALYQPSFQVQPAGNVTLILQADGWVLVDAGGSPGAARRVIETVRAMGDLPVKAVILTHWHGDHPQGLAEILAEWPNARTIATTATRAHLADPATMNTPATPDAARNQAFQAQVAGYEAYSREMAAKAPTERQRQGWAGAATLFQMYAADMQDATTVAPREGFTDRLLIDDPEAPVEALFLGRANTDGDAVVWLPRQKVLVTGDAVVAPIPFGFGGYPADWLATLQKLRAYEFKTLIPGHGQPQHDRAYLDRLSALLADVRAQVAPLKDLPLAEVQKKVDFSVQAKAFVGDDPWLRQWFDQYWVQPIVASAWKEARGEPIVQSLKGG